MRGAQREGFSVRALLRQTLQAARRSPAETVRTFLGETIWRWDMQRMRPAQRMGVSALRILYLVGRAFVSSRAQQQAMALTYTTMLALVPAFAIIVAVFSVRGLQEARGRLETFIIDFLAASPAQEQILSGYLSDLVQNMRGSGGVAGAAFFVFLFFTIVALLSTLEKTLNDIWQIKRQRSFVNKFVTYWCIATLGPICLGIALAQGSSLEHRLAELTHSAKSQASAFISGGEEEPEEDEAPEALFAFGGVGGALAAELEASDEDPTLEWLLTGTRTASESGGFSFIALGLTILTFTLFYAFLPNAHVRLKPALVGAVVATLLWLGTKWALTFSSTTLVRYNTIYGSLATIPITMFWLYLTWLIMILGAEVSFALQNIKTQRKEELASETTQLFSELVALRLCAAISRRFERGDPPPRIEELAELSGAPHSLCADLLFHFSQDGILRVIELPNEDHAYLPARPLDALTVNDIIDSLRHRRGIEFDLKPDPELEVVREHLDRANAASTAMSRRVTLRQIVSSTERRREADPADQDPAGAASEGLTPEAAAATAATSQAIRLVQSADLRGMRPTARFETAAEPTTAASGAADQAERPPEMVVAALGPRAERAEGEQPVAGPEPLPEPTQVPAP